jgi:CheY-like chemotaxis protein
MRPNTLHVDRSAPSNSGRARSREEAIQRLISEEFDSIVLHTKRPGRDPYRLIPYLRQTWPDYLRTIVIRTSTVGADSFIWKDDQGAFEREPRQVRRGMRRAVAGRSATQTAD